MIDHTVYGDMMNTNNIFNKFIEWTKTEGVKLALALIVLYFVFKLINYFSKRIERKLKNKKHKLDETITSVLLRIFRIGLKVLAFVSFLSYIGIETTSIAAAITSAGLGVGLALQGSLSNFAGGVIILIMRPFKLGDYIECNDMSGTVEDIKLFYTYITTIDNKVIMIPNGKIADSSIINYSSKNLRRLDMLFNVEYTSDIKTVKKALLESVNNSSLYNKDKEPFINIEEYKESYIKVVLKVWCNNSNYWDLYYFLQEEVKRQFEKYDIKVPYNKVNVIQ